MNNDFSGKRYETHYALRVTLSLVNYDPCRSSMCAMLHNCRKESYRISNALKPPFGSLVAILTKDTAVSVSSRNFRNRVISISSFTSIGKILDMLRVGLR